MDERFSRGWDNAMIIKGLVDEDFVNYKEPCMYICSSKCSFKCDDENGGDYCQNSSLVLTEDMNIDDNIIIERYLNNPITKAICISGLEPFDQIDEVLKFIDLLRNKYKSDDMVVIYSGYNKNEIAAFEEVLKQYKNIIVKYGRYVPGERKHKDPVLGVKLASWNQYAEQIS